VFAPRSARAFILGASLCLYPSLCGAGSQVPLGILTQACDAHLNEAAFPGLSVLEGEEVSTGARRPAGSACGPNDGLAGGVQRRIAAGNRKWRSCASDRWDGLLSSPENGIVEIHAEEAFLRPGKNQLSQAEVTMLAPGVLQIRARRGDLAFRYREEFQVLPEGATYRI
jgi:hypothetical protein